MADSKLVEKLEQYPAIWDCSSPLYSDRIKKQQSFEQLAKEVGIDLQTVKTKYKTLRTNFRKVSRLHPEIHTA